ncbi:MAG: metal ABC transporter permease [Chloroflexota bacterium]|nr:MAG: metal ABC transporter permease [Chloroflexota bacterium]
MTILIEPLSLGFMQTGLLAALCVSLACASVGIYVVLRRMAFIGDALAHTILPGVVIAYLNNWSLLGGAVVAGLATALAIGWITRRDIVREDTAIGVVFTALFALGVLLASTVRSFRDLSSILFGNILGVTSGDVVALAIVAALAMTILVFTHKELVLTSVDPTYARVIGLRPDLLRYVLLILLAFTVVAGVQAVGVLLTSALLVTPAAAASLVTNRVPRMMAVAVGIAATSSIAGLYASYYLAVSAGAAIVLSATVLFGLAWMWRAVRSAQAGNTHRA